ncbi:ATP-binding protein [Kitasatospora sp. NPDC098663]|uniref:ATP-binding protein n=1 Tax=Kitasatospora sp. NPDC098663 TaxID=3364096 RepID=UPI0038295EC4
MHRVFEYRTPLRTASVGAIRNQLRDRVNGLAAVALDDDQAYALRVCTSEFVTNAIKYGGEHGEEEADLIIEGEIHPSRGRLRITVTDPRPTVPDMGSRFVDLDATSGRGITVAAGYADGTGWHQRLDSKGRAVGWSVWFELDVELLEGFGQATALTEVQPETSVQTSAPRLTIASVLARRNLFRLHWPTPRRRERTVA